MQETDDVLQLEPRLSFTSCALIQCWSCSHSSSYALRQAFYLNLNIPTSSRIHFWNCNIIVVCSYIHKELLLKSFSRKSFQSCSVRISISHISACLSKCLEFLQQFKLMWQCLCNESCGALIYSFQTVGWKCLRRLNFLNLSKEVYANFFTIFEVLYHFVRNLCWNLNE